MAQKLGIATPRSPVSDFLNAIPMQLTRTGHPPADHISTSPLHLRPRTEIKRSKSKRKREVSPESPPAGATSPQPPPLPTPPAAPPVPAPAPAPMPEPPHVGPSPVLPELFPRRPSSCLPDTPRLGPEDPSALPSSILLGQSFMDECCAPARQLPDSPPSD
eukprot:gnl/Trimastix_PCT/192.p1 GENE.gnl/Trimastix_PCT/192~~gnl/Trimastix_PCT/192.p1  ORF type:complete len:161 (+),score=15.40 gnl/Trimastix_PCT/192:270-752(+)